MAKQLNVKLNFSADTQQAEKALASLTQHLNSISNLTPTAGTKLSNDLQLAKKSAQELQQHLINAYNTKTGNLDLNKLDASLKSSGQNLGQLSSNLLKAGSTGEQAFLNIQKAIGNASVQINQANGLLSQFWTTLKNTARWQISSSILHGFIGGLQSAWGYAKDLDESLNNIRIVTGYSSDKMAEFAESANKAAKALSTTTTKYTDAALIYYQQGLSDAEVAKRTEVTVKMANAAGQSAQTVSDQLTAVWNNFYDGSKSLEYYADVMTALGAATASSTDEIAGGLEKFAAIGETIGLSYEYAASALATITSNTRQSEDVVGTALKTIFARIQGLNLGETLDDGVTLNKYSAALESIGISIFDQQGELKKMDNILDEMGAKWDTLNKAQQTALAQTVAGVRQYTQLVALMDNWDKDDSDSMKANLSTAYGSEGALQEQADIYADSWDAAMDRVKSSAEGIYQDLFPTEELTGLADGFAVFLEGIDGAIQGLGGLQGVLLLISSIVLNTFKNQIGSAIDNLISSIGGGLTNAVKSVGQAFTNAKGESIGFVGNVKGIKGALEQVVGLSNSSAASAATLSNKMAEVANATGNVEKQSALMDQNLTSGVSGMLEKSMELSKVVKDTSGAYGQYNTNMMEINNTQAIIEQSAKHLTSEQQAQLTLLQEQAQVANEQVYAAQQLVEAEEQRAQIAANQAGSHVEDMDRFVEDEKTGVGFKSSLLSTQGNQQVANDMLGLFKDVEKGWEGISDKVSIYGRHLGVAFDDTVDIVAVNKKANSTYGIMSKKLAEIEKTGKTMGRDSDAYKAKLQQVSTELQKQEGFAGAVARKYLTGKNSVKEIEQGIRDAANATATFAKLTGSGEGDISRINGAMQRVVDSTYNAGVAAENFKNKMNQVGQTLQNALSGALSFGHVLSSMVGGFSSIAMGINAISNAMDTLKDDDASFTSKLTAGAMAATMSVRGLMTVLGGAKTFIKSYQTAMAAKNAIDLASKVSTDENARAQLENLLVTKLGVAEDEKAAAAEALVTVAEANGTAATIADTGANWANVASQMAKFWWISLIIAAVALLVGGIIALAASYETAEEKAAKAKETQEQCAEALDNAKEAAEALADSWDKYDSAVEKLKECTKGTEEWEEALKNVNDATLEVLKNLPDDLSVDEIKSLYNKEGFLDEKKIKGYQNRLNNNVRTATVAEASASKEVSELKIQVDLKRDIQDLIEAGALGASYNTYDNRGKVTGTSYLGLNADKSSGTIMENLDTLANLNFEAFKNRLSELGMSLHNVSSEDLLVFQQQVDAAARSAEGAAEKMKLIVGIQIDDKYGGNLTGSEKTGVTEITDELTEDYKDYYRAILTSNKDNLSSEYKAQYKKDYGHDYGGISQGGNENNQVFKDIIEDAALYGLNWEIGDKNAVQGNDNNRKFSLVVDGQKEELYSASWVAKQLGAARAMHETDASLESVQTILSSLNNVDPSGALAGMMADGTVSVDNLQDLSKVTDEDLGEKIKTIYAGLDEAGQAAFLQAYDVEKIEDLTTKIDDQVGNLKELKTNLQSFAIGDTNLLDFGIDNQMSLEATQELYNTLSDIEQIGTGNVSSETFLQNLTDMVSGIEDPEEKTEALNRLASIDWTSWNAMDQAALIVEDFGGSIDLTDEKWTNFADNVRKATLAFPEYDNLKNTMQEISGIVNDLEMGSVISDEDYEKLIAYNAALKDLFILQADGSRVFIGDSNAIKESTEKNLQAMREDLELRKTRAQAIKDEGADYNFSAMDIDERWGDGEDGMLSASNDNVKDYWGRTDNFASGQDAMNWALAAEGQKAWDSEAIRQVLQDQGYSEEDWAALIQAAKDGSTEGLQTALDFISQYVNEDFAQADIELDEMMASTATSIDELNNLLANGQIGPGAYSKQLQHLTNAGMAAATSLSELYSIAGQGLENGATIDYNTYAESLIRIGEEYSNTSSEVNRYQQALESGKNTEIAAAEASLEAAIQAGEMAEQYGLTAEHIERYADELKSSGKYAHANEKALINMAKDQLRFDKAVVKAADNMETWTKDLKVAEKTGHLAAESADGMAEAYGDLLDIDGSELSSDFLKNAKNLEDMQKALEGDEEAYKRLQEAARQDIATRIGLDDADFQSKFANLMSQYYEGQSLDDIAVGASLDNAGFLQGLTDMVNAAGMTAQEATDYLSSMGVDAEVVTEPETVEEVQGYNLVATPSTTSVAYNPGAFAGGPAMATFPGVTYQATPVTTTKTVQGTALKVTSASKSSGGGVKHGDSTAANGKSSGGGGGGGKKNITRKDSRNDGERYHYLANQLEDLESEYNAISDAADRAFGADKLKLMDAQIEKTKELQKQNEDYIAALKDNHENDKLIMEAQYKNLLGDSALEFEFDENGEIKNFDDIQKSMIDDYNAKASQYEAGDMSEEEWQAYEKLYEQMGKDIEMYEQSEDDLRDALARRQELINQEIDAKLAKVEYRAKIKLDVSQDDLDIIEYQLEMLDDKAFSSAERIEKSVIKVQNLTNQTNITQQALKDTLKATGISDGELSSLMSGDMSVLEGKTITEAQVDAIRGYRDSLLDMNKQLEEVRDTIQEEVTAAFEEYNEELDKGISKFEHYNSVLESYQNIIDIVGKDVLGISDDTLAEMSATQVENSINQLASVKEKVDSINKARDDAYAKMNDMTLTEADRERWAETYETMNEAAQEAQEELLSTWEGTLEAIVAQFDQAVQSAVDKFNQAFYESGLEGLSEDFSFAQEQDDMYLEDYQKIYELSKLTRDINKTMDDTKSIAGKQKLKSLMEDINKLQEEGVEMSEYDLEYLQAEYELRLAEIALEEAQRAKDTVRLSRDSEGNFSYVYTQNTDAVDEAQQKYEDALYSMQDLSSNYIDEMSAKLIETSQAMQEELAALRVEDYANIDEYYAAVAEVEAKYQDQLSAQEAELQKAIGNNKKLYDEDWANYAAVTGYKISATEDFVTSWGDTTLAQMMGLDDATSFTDVMAGAAESLVAGLLEAANTYYTNVDEANEAAGTSTGQFAEVLQENIDAIKTESADAATAVEDMANKMDTAMQDIINKTAEWQREHGANIDKIIEDNLRAAESYNGLLEYLTNNAVGDYEVLVRPSSNGSGESGDSSEGEGFATGGYTGSWGASGKLAWLHEKELILNKNDTENMLKMIELTRAMISTIDAQASQLSQGMGMMSAATYKEDRHEILEQFVEIKADFPNVSNHTEIEEALGNLINTASQYAHRRK